MTTANAQPRMTYNTDAMAAAPQLSLATNAQSMAAIDAFRYGFENLGRSGNQEQVL